MPRGYNLTDQAFLMKETYSEMSQNHYNSATAILSRCRKRYDLQGIKDHIAIPQGPDGGFGGTSNGYLPSASGESGDQMEIEAKDVFSRARIQHKAMKASMTSKGAFAQFTNRPVQKCVEGYNTGCNILWHGDGTGRVCKSKDTGALISGDATTFTLEMDPDNWHPRWWTQNQLYNIANAADNAVEDGLFKLKTVSIATKRVTFERVEGTFDITSGSNANDRYIYFQNMFKDAPEGFESTIMKQTGNIYTIPYDEVSWGALILDADGAPPSPSLLNKAFNVQATRVDESAQPDMRLTSPEVWAILSDIPEYQKRINLMPRDKRLSSEYGFGIGGLSYTRPDGKVIPIVPDKHCKRTRIYGLNSDMMYMYHLPDHGWVDDDGRVFMREANKLFYEGTYGGYFQNVVHPTFQLVIDDIDIGE